MSISKPTPKDIGNYEAKLIGPFTQRQSVFLGIGAIPAVAASALMKSLNADGYAILGVVMLIMIIPAFLAFGEKLTHGMKPEDFIIGYYQYHIASPGIRLYKTETIDDKLDYERKKTLEHEEIKNGTKSRKKDPHIEEIRRSNMGTRFISPKYTAYKHATSKNCKEYK